MNELAQHCTDEHTGISYTLSTEGYYLPNLALPDEPEYHIGRYGLMRKRYLMEHRKGLFTNLLTTDKLNAHLAEIEETASDRLWLIIDQMARAEGITEDLKARNPLEWVGRMNNIRSRAEEIVRAELIYS